MGWLIILAAVVLLPLLAVAVDAIAGLRSRNKEYEFGDVRSSDFEVLVPIYGSVTYLENIDYLSQYGGKVLLCTTAGETQQFYDELYRICFQNNFRLFVATFGRTDNVHKRSTSGTIRDRLIRDALPLVQASYVVPVDADTTTTAPLDALVGELERKGYDLASVRLVPQNTDTLLARLQGYEYRLAMQFRFLATWLVSGACHVARTAVLTDVMNRHSLFFQGNDVEIGLIARLRGYRVGHIPFEVPTVVPASFKAWVRQRLAWAGGEFRLFVVNFRYVVRHPFLWIYGGLVTIALFPMRWLAFAGPGEKVLYCTGLVATLALYVALVLRLHWRNRSWSLMVMPLYMLATSMIMTPLGIAWYCWMAWKDRNAGVIHPDRVRPQSEIPSPRPEPAHAWVRHYI
ncbi:glycosyltransferase family 2 protein [Actinopolymorpha sp. B17G11]|uniref:glycosyltransferase family 2 protein n=1 Tax=Actinopolymorpha sp. B17G11 TaxID=3160861 RepID=UPI0032E47E93